MNLMNPNDGLLPTPGCDGGDYECPWCKELNQDGASYVGTVGNLEHHRCINCAGSWLWDLSEED